LRVWVREPIANCRAPEATGNEQTNRKTPRETDRQGGDTAEFIFGLSCIFCDLLLISSYLGQQITSL